MNQPPEALQPAPPSPPVAKKGIPTWLIVLFAVAGCGFIVLPVLAVLAIYGVRKYLANAKTAEARVALVEIAKDAATTFDPKRGFCPSASRPIPASASSVSGLKYQSASGDWTVDRAQNAGFACLGFSLEMPQYFQYSYTGSKTAFEAVAHGDLNGDGVASTFRVHGQAGPDGVVTIAPRVEEENPEE